MGKTRCQSQGRGALSPEPDHFQTERVGDWWHPSGSLRTRSFCQAAWYSGAFCCIGLLPPFLAMELNVCKDGAPLYEHNKIIMLLRLSEDSRSRFCQEHGSIWQRG